MTDKEMDQLNADVAVKVFGLTLDDNPDDDGTWPAILTVVREPGQEVQFTRIPAYCADTPEGWAAMRSVVERMREKGWRRCETIIDGDERWAGFGASGWHVIGRSAKTLPEAVCRAALAALESTDA